MKHKINIILLVVLGICIANKGFTQKHRKTPVGYYNKAVSIPFIAVPTLSNKEINKSLSKAQAEKHALLSIGKQININFNAKAGKHQIKGGNLRQLKIAVQGVKGIALSFDQFNLAPEAEFYIYNEEHTASIGPFTRIDVVDTKNFATLPLQGTHIILELYEPKNKSMESTIHIDGISLVPESLTKTQQIINQTLNREIGINCPEGQAWQKEKNAIVAIVYKDNSHNYWNEGTAALVRKVHPDGSLHMLCAKTNFQPSYPSSDYIRNIVWHSFFVFNYDAIGCTTTIKSPEQVSTYPNVYVGSFHGVGNSGNTNNNMALLYVLADRVPDDAKYYQLGWDISSDNYSAYSPFAIIGHEAVEQYNGYKYIRSKSIAFANYNYPSYGGFYVYLNDGSANFSGAPVIETRHHRYIGVFEHSDNSVTSLKHMWNYSSSTWGSQYILSSILGSGTNILTTDGLICIETKNITYTSPIYSTQNIKADENIYISSVVYGGSCIAAANESIELKPGFEVKPGASFEANNNPCH